MASVPPRRGFWQRISSAIRGVFRPSRQAPEAPKPSLPPLRQPEPPSPPPPPPPAPTPVPDYYPVEEAPSSRLRTPAELEAEFAGYRETTYDFIGEEFRITEDEFAMGLLYEGWFDEGINPDERAQSREMFFDYMGIDSREFYWTEWREWYYGAAAA